MRRDFRQWFIYELQWKAVRLHENGEKWWKKRQKDRQTEKQKESHQHHNIVEYKNIKILAKSIANFKIC